MRRTIGFALPALALPILALAILTLAILALLLAAWPAAAHTGGATGFATVAVQDRTVRYSLTLGADVLSVKGGDSASLPRLQAAPDYDAVAATVARAITVSADGRPCVAAPGTVTPPSPERANLVVVVLYVCPTPVRSLALRDDLADMFGPDYHTLASIEGPGGREQLLFQPDRREAVVALGGPTAEPASGHSAQSGALAFFLLGIEHILLGFDHLLFLFALLLRGGRMRSLLLIVTAFTVAHSITLTLSVLDLATVPGWIVEPVIALSIAYVALENILFENAASRRWAVSFLFGLVHGFGFAGVLRELEMPTDTLVTSLLSFNLGVEAGQAVVIAILLPVLLWLHRFAWERRAVTAMSVLVFVTGITLLIERALFAEG